MCACRFRDVHDVAVRAEGLSKSFGKTRALEGIDLEVPRGMVFGLLGPNGSGKSTLLDAVTGYADRPGISVEIDGVDAAEAAAIADVKPARGAGSAIP